MRPERSGNEINDGNNCSVMEWVFTESENSIGLLKTYREAPLRWSIQTLRCCSSRLDSHLQYVHYIEEKTPKFKLDDHCSAAKHLRNMCQQNTWETAIYTSSSLLIKTFQISVTSVVNFLITCSVSEWLKDKVTSHPTSWMFKKSMTSQPG